MSLRSWVRDKIEGFFEWMYKGIIEPALDWLRRAIENVVVALRIFRHNLKAKLAEWMQNDAFFLGFIVVVVAAIVFIPKLIVKAQGWVATIWVQSMAIKIKEATVNILDANKIIDLVMVHKILMVLWEDYKQTFYSFADAVSQLSAELGEGSAYLHAYFASIRGIMHGTNAIIGGDPLQVEIEWYGRTSAFFERANDRFNRYARDPGRMLYDFIDEVLIPAAEENRDVSQAQVDEIRENRDRLVEVDEGQKELQTSLDTFIELQPNAIEEQIRVRWDPINEAWQDIQDIFFDEMMRVVNGVVDAVEWHHQKQLEINAAAKKNAESGEHLADIMMQMEDDEQRILGEAYDHILAQGTLSEREAFALALSRHGHDYDSITTDYIHGIGVSPSLEYEPIFSEIRPDLPLDIPSPFVGDY